MCEVNTLFFVSFASLSKSAISYYECVSSVDKAIITKLIFYRFGVIKNVKHTEQKKKRAKRVFLCDYYELVLQAGYAFSDGVIQVSS